MQISNHNLTIAFLSVILVSSNAAGDDSSSTTCAKLEKRAQEGPLDENEKIIFHACVQKGAPVSNNKEVLKAISNARNDVTKGPGPNNDLVGRKGWLRSRLGF